MSPAASDPLAGPQRAIVFAGGDRCQVEDLRGLRHEPSMVVIAADSGADHACALGWPVDVLVGDLDSVDPVLAAALERSGTEVQRYPTAKDQTDLAIALDTALATGAARITVVGGHGGRLDHLLANVLLLAADRYAAVELDALLGPARVAIVRGRRAVAGVAGEVVTLLALGGPAKGVSTGGLLFSLDGATLEPGSSWGVSNELVDPIGCWVEVLAGVVAVVQPGVRGAFVDRAELADP